VYALKERRVPINMIDLALWTIAETREPNVFLKVTPPDPEYMPGEFRGHNYVHELDKDASIEVTAFDLMERYGDIPDRRSETKEMSKEIPDWSPGVYAYDPHQKEHTGLVGFPLPPLNKVNKKVFDLLSKRVLEVLEDPASNKEDMIHVLEEETEKFARSRYALAHPSILAQMLINGFDLAMVREGAIRIRYHANIIRILLETLQAKDLHHIPSDMKVKLRALLSLLRKYIQVVRVIYPLPPEERSYKILEFLREEDYRILSEQDFHAYDKMEEWEAIDTVIENVEQKFVPNSLLYLLAVLLGWENPKNWGRVGYALEFLILSVITFFHPSLPGAFEISSLAFAMVGILSGFTFIHVGLELLIIKKARGQPSLFDMFVSFGQHFLFFSPYLVLPLLTTNPILFYLALPIVFLIHALYDEVQMGNNSLPSAFGPLQKNLLAGFDPHRTRELLREPSELVVQAKGWVIKIGHVIRLSRRAPYAGRIAKWAPGNELHRQNIAVFDISSLVNNKEGSESQRTVEHLNALAKALTNDSQVFVGTYFREGSTEELMAAITHGSNQLNLTPTATRFLLRQFQQHRVVDFGKGLIEPETVLQQVLKMTLNVSDNVIARLVSAHIYQLQLYTARPERVNVKSAISFELFQLLQGVRVLPYLPFLHEELKRARVLSIQA